MSERAGREVEICSPYPLMKKNETCWPNVQSACRCHRFSSVLFARRHFSHELGHAGEAHTDF